jgi:hypothetical protein
MPVDGFRGLSDALVWLVEAYERVRAANPSTWTPGSPAETEVARDTGRWGPGTVRNAHVDALLPMASASDHLGTLADVLRSSRGIFASYTLARGAVEAASRTWYLLAPDLGPDERARRRVNERLYSLHAESLLLGSVDEPTDEQKQRIDELLAGPARRGEYVKRAKGYEAPFVGQKRPTEMSLLSEMLADAEDGFDVGGASYRLLSSVAHSIAYGLVHLIEPIGSVPETAGVSRGRVRQSSATTAGAFMAVPLVFAQAASRVFLDYAWDATGWPEPVVAALTRWRDHAQSGAS